MRLHKWKFGMTVLILLFLFVFLLLQFFFSSLRIRGLVEPLESNKSAGRASRHIVLISQERDNPFWLAVEHGAREASRTFGLELEYVGPFRFNPAEQYKLLEKMIAAKADAILVQGIHNPLYRQLSLTIQPLVENAFMHGIAGMESGAVIRLEAKCHADCVQLTVRDNGAGMSDEVRQSLLNPNEAERTHARYNDSTGLGTRNVFKRLLLFYGKNDLVHIESGPGKGTAVMIKLPFAPDQGGNAKHVPAADCG